MHDEATHAILGRALLAFALALIGGGVSASIKLSHQRLCVLISFAAGTLLGVTVAAILPESATAMPWWELAIAFGTGYAAFALLTKYVFHVCPACAASHFDEATTHRFSEIASGLIIALAIHSTLDGLALAAGHESHDHGAHLDLSLLLAICVHKVPEGLALGALLLGAGFSKLRAMCWVAAVESTTVLGGILGVLFLDKVPPVWVAAVLAHVGGGFLFLAGHAIFGELMKHDRKSVLLSFGTGLLLLVSLNLLFH
jgi:zinc transporter ZupT